MANSELLSDTKTSLERVQKFDAESLVRTADLGLQMNFEGAVEPAKRIVILFKRVPISILDDLTDSQLQIIRGRADTEFNRFNEILKFSADQGNANQTRINLLNQMATAYDGAFQDLWQFIAYGIATITDTAAMEGRARAALQSMEDRANAVAKQMQDRETQAAQILQDIQAVAAEQGVSQQAEFFKKRADEHATQVTWWRNATAVSLICTIVFAFFSAIAYKIPWLHQGDQYEALEFITGKILVFITLGGLIALCAKNFLAHQHNVVLNRHRQTALQTYRVLVSAGSSGGSQDIVLAYAASCVFGNQDTGFSKEGGDGGASKSVLELMTKSVVGSASPK